jgi:hypothetical protein
VAHGGGDEVGAAAAQRHGLLAVQLGALAAHGAQNEKREGTHPRASRVECTYCWSARIMAFGEVGARTPTRGRRGAVCASDSVCRGRRPHRVAD